MSATCPGPVSNKHKLNGCDTYSYSMSLNFLPVSFHRGIVYLQEVLLSNTPNPFCQLSQHAFTSYVAPCVVC